MNTADDLKLAEDSDNDGLVDRFRPARRWLLWVTDAFTEFANGAIAALLSGIAGGSLAGAGTASQLTLDPATIRFNALIGFVLPLIVNGGVALKAWHKANPMPNPFRP